MNCGPKIRAILEGIWGCGFADCCIRIGPNSLPIMGWYVVYSVMLPSWLIVDCFRVQITCMYLCKLCLKNWCG